ncbi:origin recognition complex subunit 2 [Bacillus rossius redtenbacheri]|uniref:origin recognition complex subunit 2 n=1 Tax=Bacillus rossius redtenbacheri TaxID=93214 RepID=UPI002FDDFA21
MPFQMKLKLSKVKHTKTKDDEEETSSESDSESEAARSFPNRSVKLKHSKVKHTKMKDGVQDGNGSESDSESEITRSLKNHSVLCDRGNISGQRIFGFKTPKKKDAMAQKAAQSVGTPSPKTPKHQLSGTARNISLTPKTPKGLPKSKTGTPKSACGTPKSTHSTPRSKLGTPRTPHTPHGSLIEVARVNNTPYSLRTKVKKFISHMAEKELLEDSDISPDESSYDISSEEGSTESSSDSEVEESPKGTPDLKTSCTPRQSARKRKDLNFIPVTDDYFQTMNAKSVTSNHTLRRLKNPRLAQDQVRELLGQVADLHKENLQALSLEHCANFSKWMICLREGFSVMLYGIGSKRNLLMRFQELYLSHETVLIVNGFFPSLTIKEILDSVVKSVLGLDWSGSTADCLSLIEREFQSDENLSLYLIVHNIDGPTLRTHKVQDVLARLAAVRNIYLLASVDHINAPLIWDQRKLSIFNFRWWDATTLLPYMAETSFETSLLGQQTGSLALSSLRNVFRSLTNNSREIFLLIVRHQLTNKSNASYTGIAFRDLYRSCRENLLVSSDLALRAQLSEFLDHHLVKSRRSIDGTEMLTIPIENTILQQFIDQQAEEP